jgi:hypothetical protein
MDYAAEALAQRTMHCALSNTRVYLCYPNIAEELGVRRGIDKKP